MLSIIICSINKDYLQLVKANLIDTVGVEYELLVWDNNAHNWPICKVYNEMAQKAKFQYMAFIHEDIFFKTKNWGALIVNLLNNELVGLIGVAGGKYKSNLLSGWYSGVHRMDYYHVTHIDSGKEEPFSNADVWPSSEIKVATVDGLFMCCSKKVWMEVKFGEEYLKGFHFYDIDFSLRIAQNLKVLVTKQLDIIHFSKGGDFGNKWVKDAFIFHQKMKSVLPFCTELVDVKKANVVVAIYWLDWLKNQPISLRFKFSWIFKQHLHRNYKLWYSILKFLLYKPLGLKRIHYFFKSLRK